MNYFIIFIYVLFTIYNSIDLILSRRFPSSPQRNFFSSPGLTFTIIQYQFSICSITIVKILNCLVGRWCECLINIEKLKSNTKTNENNQTVCFPNDGTKQINDKITYELFFWFQFQISMNETNN